MGPAGEKPGGGELVSSVEWLAEMSPYALAPAMTMPVAPKDTSLAEWTDARFRRPDGACTVAEVKPRSPPTKESPLPGAPTSVAPFTAIAAGGPRKPKALGGALTS